MVKKSKKMADDMYEKAETKVWWDIEHCPIPKGVKPDEIVQKITSALNKMNYRGPVSISAFGNLNHIPPSVKKALTSTGIVLEHIPSRKIRLTLHTEAMFWKINHPAPANVMFIVREMSFTPDDPRSDEYKYNVLLAHPPNASCCLLSSVDTAWIWSSLLEEEE